MKAIAVIPGTPNSIHLRQVNPPRLHDIPFQRGVLIRVLRVGVDGTDKEIHAAEYGQAPPGDDFLITGHECFGQVLEVGSEVAEFAPGDFVVPTVRRPGQSFYDQIGQYDMTTNDAIPFSDTCPGECGAFAPVRPVRMDGAGPCRSLLRAKRRGAGRVRSGCLFYGTTRCQGFSSFAADYLGSTCYFSTMSHRDTFTSDPERFSPQYGGYCAFGVAKGYKAAIDPEAFTIVEGKLYVNYSPSVLASWRKDIPGYIRQADRHWPEVSQHTKVRQ